MLPHSRRVASLPEPYHLVQIHCETASVDMSNIFLEGAKAEDLPSIALMLAENPARITEVDRQGNISLLLAAQFGELTTTQYLLEHGGADIGDMLITDGDTIWDLLAEYLIEDGNLEDDEDDDKPYVYDATAVTSLLRAMVLRGAPPAELRARLSPEHAQVIEDGTRLRVALTAYLARRRALLDAHCPLISPLRSLVHGYEEPTTTAQLWATYGAGRGEAMCCTSPDARVILCLK
jgi:hypothetical protein